MPPIIRCLALMLLFALGATAYVNADDRPLARFSDAFAYTGPPNLALTLSMVMAGGGPNNFDTTKLMHALWGEKAPAEANRLIGEFGQQEYASFIVVFEYVVSDTLQIAAAKHIALPSKPVPSPSDGHALAMALYTSGITGGRFDSEFLLDHLASHPIHVQVMDDIDKKYGRKADGIYHIILHESMEDLKGAYNM